MLVTHSVCNNLLAQLDLHVLSDMHVRIGFIRLGGMLQQALLTTTEQGPLWSISCMLVAAQNGADCRLTVCWFAGLLVCWSAGLLICWFAGLLVC